MAKSCKMTKMHFQCIAETIASIRALHPADRSYIAQAFAISLSNTNPAFRTSEFLEACKSETDKAVDADKKLESK